jgi:hypothetical protein
MGKLSIITTDTDYAGQYDFSYPQEIRIVGRVTGFAARLPLTDMVRPALQRCRRFAPLILPWEHTSFHALIAAERKRFGITEDVLIAQQDSFYSAVGTSVSPRTLRRYQSKTTEFPHTGVLLALTLLHSLRFTDVQRLLDPALQAAYSYSLDTLLGVNSQREFPLCCPVATAPTPSLQWSSLLDEWGAWPILLNMAVPNLEQSRHRVLRINQSTCFKGLDPLVPPHSLLALEECEGTPNTQAHKGMRDWERPIYALRHKDTILCGHLEVDANHYILIPHPQAGSIPRVTFRRCEVQMLGKIVGLVAPL